RNTGMGGSDADAGRDGSLEVRVLPSPAVLRGPESPQYRSDGGTAAALRARGRARRPQRARAQFSAFAPRRDRLLRQRRRQQARSRTAGPLRRGSYRELVEPCALSCGDDRGFDVTVRVVGELDDAQGTELRDVPRHTPAGSEVTGPIVLRL